MQTLSPRIALGRRPVREALLSLGGILGHRQSAAVPRRLRTQLSDVSRPASIPRLASGVDVLAAAPGREGSTRKDESSAKSRAVAVLIRATSHRAIQLLNLRNLVVVLDPPSFTRDPQRVFERELPLPVEAIPQRLAL